VWIAVATSRAESNAPCMNELSLVMIVERRGLWRTLLFAHRPATNGDAAAAGHDV
jgi:hypothetical protein